MSNDICKVATEEQAMNMLITEARLRKENQAFVGTPGVSQENCGNGFIPAFYDMDTGQVEISRFLNGQPAPMHMIEGLPKSWVAARDADCKTTAIKGSVIAGFVREGCFYTRSEAAEAVLDETTLCPDLQQKSARG